MNAGILIEACPVVQKYIKSSKILSLSWSITGNDGIRLDVVFFQIFSGKSQV